MSSFSSVKLNVIGAISTLETALTDYPVIWPNAPVDDGADLTKFVVIDVVWGRAERADIGTGAASVRQRVRGILQIAIYGELFVGESEIMGKADIAAALVRHVSSGAANGGVHFRTPSIASRGRVNDGNHWRVDIEAPFYADITS